MLSWLKQTLLRPDDKAPSNADGSLSKKFGALGEAEAARFLAKERGMKILVRNWRSPKDKREEIDIICKDGDVLVFVEVKTYPTARLFNGYEIVNKRKKETIKRAATAYLHSLGKRWQEMSYRMDVVVIERTDNGNLVPHHFENVAMGD